MKCVLIALTQRLEGRTGFHVIVPIDELEDLMRRHCRQHLLHNNLRFCPRVSKGKRKSKRKRKNSNSHSQSQFAMGHLVKIVVLQFDLQ